MFCVFFLAHSAINQALHGSSKALEEKMYFLLQIRKIVQAPQSFTWADTISCATEVIYFINYKM